MRRLLVPRNIGIVEQIAWSRVLLAFDFDGTLAPIVAALVKFRFPSCEMLLLM
jgi:hypothetical protein